jgi:hypothetical protein
MVIFEVGSHFMFGLAWMAIFLFVFSFAIAGMIGTHHQAQPLVEIGSHIFAQPVLDHVPPNLHLSSS